MIRRLSIAALLLLTFALIVPEATQAATIDLDWKSNTHHGTTFINQGDTVRWTWQDTRSHTVSATGGLFDSGTLVGSGTQFSFTFTTLGSFHYFCMVHGAPSMDGTIEVAAPVSVKDASWGAIKRLFD